MSQGTWSLLAGCHSPVHSVCVTAAWRRLYGRWPRAWELACIFLHDIGHAGRPYLDDPAQKAEHWRLGAQIAGTLFGPPGWSMCAGHCTMSGAPLSPLYRADKLSWAIAPIWWLYTNAVLEPELRCGAPVRRHVEEFRAEVRRSIESGTFEETHSFYLRRREHRSGERRGDGRDITEPRAPAQARRRARAVARGA